MKTGYEGKINLEVFIEDSKGITEYTSEDWKDPKLQKQIKIAAGALEMVIKKLCRQFPLLHPAIRHFECVAVKEDIDLETDGIHVFYQPKRIQKFYINKKLNALEAKYMHLVIHGLLGHFNAHQKLGEDPLWDAVMDYEITMIMNRISSHFVKGMETKQPGTRGLYWYANSQPKIKAKLKGQKNWDNHQIWERNLKKKIGTLQSWEEIQELVGIGKGLDEQKLKKILAGKLAGTKRGELEEAYEAAEENGNSYREHILQFIREREMMKEQDGTIDKMLYSFGFELYGDVAFIEPEEFSEGKAMNKVVIAVDTSGSCQGKVMNEFLRETKNLMLDISEFASFQELILLQCDTVIQKEEHFEMARELPEEKSWNIKGFGGTDFCPVFKRIEELTEGTTGEIDFLVYFSDGYGKFPIREPEYPVFFVMSEENQKLEFPEWVTTVCYKNM